MPLPALISDALMAGTGQCRNPIGWEVKLDLVPGHGLAYPPRFVTCAVAGLSQSL